MNSFLSFLCALCEIFAYSAYGCPHLEFKK
jgi:hypothetical protein